MIVREFYIKEMELRYFVGLSQIRFDFYQFLEVNTIIKEEDALQYFFTIIEGLQNNNKESIIQSIKDKYVLNQDHIYIASYYTEKAFFDKTHISKKKNLEFLLYLSTHRQISRGIESFGIDYNELKEGKLTICVISPTNNVDKIFQEILHLLNASEIKLTINNLTIEKITSIINYFEISDNQIKSVLNSYGKSDISDLKNDLGSLYLAVFDIICEKMALLNLEKIKLS